MKSIILCADDYGICLPVGEGIRQLVALKRLTAVSCMSSAPAWPLESALLKPLREQIDVGLHFNLTLGFDHSVPSLGTWLKKSLWAQIDQVAVAKAFLEQLNRFESAWGEAPDFIDSHQHVHIFPGIRNRLFQLIVKRYPAERRPWIRWVTPHLTGHDAPLKALILRVLSIGFAQKARLAGLSLPCGFEGIYSLSDKVDIATLMPGWLRRAKPGTVLMCHPSMSAEQDPEGIGLARLQEYQYLCGTAFDDACRCEKVTLSRWCNSQADTQLPLI